MVSASNGKIHRVNCAGSLSGCLGAGASGKRDYSVTLRE